MNQNPNTLCSVYAVPSIAAAMRVCVPPFVVLPASLRSQVDASKGHHLCASHAPAEHPLHGGDSLLRGLLQARPMDTSGAPETGHAQRGPWPFAATKGP